MTHFRVFPARIFAVALTLCTLGQTSGAELQVRASDGPSAIQEAINVAAPGDTIFLRGGVYRPEKQILVCNSGAGADLPIRLHAYPGEEVFVNLGQIEMDLNGTAFDATAVFAWAWQVGDGPYDNSPRCKEPSPASGYGNHWHFKGFTVTASQRQAMRVFGNHNTFEEMVFSGNGGSGLALDGGVANTGISNYEDAVARENVVLNSVSHDNFDVIDSGRSADGFEIYNGARDNWFEGNLAFRNSDDGFDAWRSISTRFTSNRAYDNCKPDNHEPVLPQCEKSQDKNEVCFRGDGDGFKLGEKPFEGASGHDLAHNVAWDNAGNGFNDNNGPALTLQNNTAWNNAHNFRMNVNLNSDHEDHVLINNLSFAGRGDDLVFKSFDESNSWNLGIINPEFRSLDPESSDFLRPAAGSPVVDAGIDVGFPFAGSAPDLGAIEVPEPNTFSMTVVCAAVLIVMSRRHGTR